MKTIAMFLRALAVATLVLLVGTSVALAHGTPTMSVQPATVAAGGKITLSGDGMGTDGQIVTISLKGMLFSATLGTAKLSDDAYNDVTFTIPAKAPPGTYLIVAQNGADNASFSLEVTASAAPKPVAPPTLLSTAVPTAIVAMATPATVAMPVATGVPTAQPATNNASAANAPADQTSGDVTMPLPGVAPVLVRVRTPVEWALPIGFAVVAGGLGLFLLTRQLS